jgi:hypothetical protein
MKQTALDEIYELIKNRQNELSILDLNTLRTFLEEIEDYKIAKEKVYYHENYNQ